MYKHEKLNSFKVFEYHESLEITIANDTEKMPSKLLKKFLINKVERKKFEYLIQ